MARSFRKRRRTNAKGENFYQIFGPNPKTGKEEYIETFKGTVKGRSASQRVDARLRELGAEAFNLTKTGKMETRKVSDLVEAFLDDIEERYRWTKQTRQWFVRGRTMRSDTRRKYLDNCHRFILPKLGDTLLISLELEDLQLMVNQVWQEVSGPTARSVGESIKTIINWGDEHGWTMPPLLLRLLRKLLLPEKRVRQYDMQLVDQYVKKFLVIVFGPRTGKTNRRTYLYRRILAGIFIGNGIRRGEAVAIEMADIDWQAGTVAITKTLDRLTGEILEGATKTRAGLRTIWLPRCVLEATLAW
jgi:integrase